MEDMYDVIIVGSGPSGLTAAIYTTRASLKTVVISGVKWGGQLQLTTEVENFPGFPEGIQGPELMMAMRKQAERFGTVFVDDDMAPTDFSTMSGGPFIISAGGKEYQGKVLLIATGADAKQLGAPGEKELTGHGISYCATCDGA
ncbi:MAG TPA: FAD-dependent oxidoreductase, partial [Candidatus Saccharimonadales bacterium]|nr:FAD-dependent oxidoreductase [Candidatus Saccharimonadales bacterium]